MSVISAACSWSGYCLGPVMVAGGARKEESWRNRCKKSRVQSENKAGLGNRLGYSTSLENVLDRDSQSYSLFRVAGNDHNLK